MLKSILESARSQYRLYRKAKEQKEYKGDQVVCPVCSATFRIFAPFGLDHRTNARCIECNSLERHRLLWLYFQRKTNFFEQRKRKLLHFAPEEMFYNAFTSNPAFEYHACDLFPEIYNYNGSTKVTKADITAIPFADSSFDIVLCNHVLEHIPDDRKAMSEIRRVLKSDGWCILQVPIDYKLGKTYEDFSITTPAGRKKAFGKTDHVRWYGRDYKDRLKEAGFTVLEDNFIEAFSKEDIFKYGLMPGELIYYCTK